MLHNKMQQLFMYVNPVFKSFYEQLLANEVFSVYFESDAQVQALLQKQKKNFIDSVTENEEAFRARFYRLGVVHFQIDIPYEAFLAGSKILNKEFVELIIREKLDTALILEVNDYFTKSSEAMAKGYLDAFIETDRKDIRTLMESVGESMGNLQARDILQLHYRWIIDLFTAIEKEDKSLAGELDFDKSTIFRMMRESAKECERMDETHFAELERVYRKIFNNARNIMFFIEKKIYTEALSLFVNLLEIYKFTLMFSNMVNTMSNFRSQKLLELKTKLSEEDPLTGAVNRRKFNELLEYALSEAKNDGVSVALIMLDIDDFKQINDSYGHSIGDEVLKAFVGILRSNVRLDDVVVRYGGEEFMVFCFDTEVRNAVALAEKLRSRIEETVFESVGKVTASFGVSGLNEEDDVDRFIKRADDNMYRSKKEGKNRVTF